MGGRRGRKGGDVIRVYPDLEALSRAATALLVAQANQAVAARGRFSVALAGGATPRRTYELLTEPSLADQVFWGRVHVFWGDERCVSLADPRSNAGMAMAAWLDRAAIPRAQIYPMDCALDPAAAARDYAARLREFFAGQPPRLDLVLLGLGSDGHTASLFPGWPALAETESWVAAVDAAPDGLHRLTLTAPLINQARMVAFLVSGPGKAAILAEILQGPKQPLRLPAQLIQPHPGELMWLVDQPAAARLPAG